MAASRSTPVPFADLQKLDDEQLLTLRILTDKEMRRRGTRFSVGEMGERLVIAHYKATRGLPKLQLAPPGTKNVDALSRNGERYSIKTALDAKKTGTIYPDPEDQDKQLFEVLILVQLNEDFVLKSIHEFSWGLFVKVRKWDRRMSAWYLPCSQSCLREATCIFSEIAGLAAAQPR
jgi:hypothetical protein